MRCARTRLRKAATNTYLLRRRHRNANGPGPLDTDTPKAIRAILNDVGSIATAQRTLAERDETFIYTHYEGWLPETLPTEEWQNTWLPLATDSRPRVSTHFKPSDSYRQLVGSCPDPTFDRNHPDTTSRFNSIRPNVRCVFENPDPHARAWRGGYGSGPELRAPSPRVTGDPMLSNSPRALR